MNAVRSPSVGAMIAQQEEARALAVSIWDRAGPVDHHPWLSALGLSASGLRQRGDRIIVPLRDFTGALWNVQLIGPGGGARCLHGGRVFGLFYRLGDPNADHVTLAARFVDAASAHAARGVTALACVTPWNVRNVAMVLRALSPRVRIDYAPDASAGSALSSMNGGGQ